MDDVLLAIRSATRKSFLRRKPMYEPYAAVGDADLAATETTLGCALPSALREMLLALGYGDLNDQLSFRKEWYDVLDRGQLKEHVVFAQDDRGNLYTFAQGSGQVHYIDRFDKSYVELAPDFASFLRGVVERNFEVVAWAESAPRLPYAIHKSS